MNNCEFCQKSNASLSHIKSCRMLHTSTTSPEVLFSLIKLLLERIDNLEDKLQKSNKPQPLIHVLNGLDPPDRSFESFYNSKQISKEQFDNCFNRDTGSFVYESNRVKNILSAWFSSSNIPIKAFESTPNTIFIYENKWIVLNTYHLKKFMTYLTKNLVKCLNDNLDPKTNKDTHSQHYCEYMMNICANKPQRNTYIKKSLYIILTSEGTSL